MSPASAGQLKIQRLVVVALGCYWAWIQTLLFNPAFFSAATGSAGAFLYNVGAHFLGLVALAALAKRFTPYVSHRAFAATSAVIVSAASVALHISTNLHLLPLEMASSALAGAGSAVFLVMWGEAYARITDPNARKTTLSISVLTAFVLFVILASLPEVLQVVIVAIAPIACVAAAVTAHALPEEALSAKQPASAPTRIEKARDLPGWTRLLACTFLFAIPMAYFKTGTQESNSTASFAVVLFLLAIIFLLDYLLRARRRLTVLPHVFVLSISGGLLLLPFLTQENLFVTGVLITAGSFSFRAYLYPLCTQVAEKSRMPVAQAFAIATCALDGGQIAGVLLRNSLATISESWFTNVTLAIVYLLFLAGFLFFTQRFEGMRADASVEAAGSVRRDRSGRLQQAAPVAVSASAPDATATSARPSHVPSAEDASAATPSVISSIENQCRRAADAFALSPREEEIAVLLVRGRSVQSIADEVTLSQNTIKTHVSHIYQKCGTHSREELIKLIESLGA